MTRSALTRLSTVAMLAVLMPALSAQQRPPRDAGAASGGARIGGVVTDVRGPVRGATLTLMSSAYRRLTTLSDEEGRFAFTGLSEDLYTLTASKDEYLAVEYGATRLHFLGTRIALTPGQQFPDLSLRLRRGGVITGTVRGADGLPATDVRISLARPGLPGLAGGMARTDSHGVYRVTSLGPGEYHVIANQPTGSVPVFHPGVIDPAQAMSVRVEEDAVRENIDIAIVSGHPTRMSGIVLDPAGQPVAGADVGARHISASYGGATAKTGADGRFVLADLVPGHYTLDARAMPPAGAADAIGLWATLDTDVPAGPLAEVTLKLQRLVVFSGRVEFDRGTLPPPTDLTGVRIFLTKPDFHPAEVNVRRDGTFEHAISAGLFEISAQTPAPGWRLRSAIAHGRDLLDLPPTLDPATGDLTGVVLTFSDKDTQLSGRVLTADGAPASDCSVIIFPADPGLWNPYSRRLAWARPATDGRFSLVGLASGDYLVAAVRDLDPIAWRTDGFLAPLVATSVRVQLREGDRKQQDLRIRQ